MIPLEQHGCRVCFPNHLALEMLNPLDMKRLFFNSLFAFQSLYLCDDGFRTRLMRATYTALNNHVLVFIVFVSLINLKLLSLETFSIR